MLRIKLLCPNTVNDQTFSYDVIAFNDLINSKIKTERPKDLYDVIELRKIQEQSKQVSTYIHTAQATPLFSD